MHVAFSVAVPAYVWVVMSASQRALSDALRSPVCCSLDILCRSAFDKVKLWKVSDEVRVRLRAMESRQV